MEKSTREGAVLEFRSRATKAAAAARTATAIGATQSRRRVGADDRIAAYSWLGIPWKKEKNPEKLGKSKSSKVGNFVFDLNWWIHYSSYFRGGNERKDIDALQTKSNQQVETVSNAPRRTLGVPLIRDTYRGVQFSSV